MVNSRDKGARGEREFSRVCRDEGYDGARRGQQFSGIEGSDVVGLPGIHIEVKRVESLNIGKAMAQSIRDAKQGEIPIVAHRKDREKWLITMRAEDWFCLFREFTSEQYLSESGVEIGCTS
jgi:Holliday junction resolvase